MGTAKIRQRRRRRNRLSRERFMFRMYGLKILLSDILVDPLDFQEPSPHPFWLRVRAIAEERYDYE
ncbi:MAG TPA: hypothetical protein VM656_14995 [Pyrinomonadaceae bacterium]|jgi:hypothetical protein|nr:hypothetical protein [Pyrinomonadaceae bacterium]